MAKRPDYITSDAVANMLPFFSRRHVIERITRQRDFPTARRIASRRFWDREEVLRWLDSRKEK